MKKFAYYLVGKSFVIETDGDTSAKKLHTKSSSLLQAGEIARSYKYLQNEFVAMAEPPNVLKEENKEKLAKKLEEGPNSIKTLKKNFILLTRLWIVSALRKCQKLLPKLSFRMVYLIN